MRSLSEPFSRLLPWVRSQFPQVAQLREGARRVYLDNAAGTLVPQCVSDAMADAALWANPQASRAWPAGPETARLHQRVRGGLAGFLNASAADRIYLTESTTASLYKLREALEPAWEVGDNVVVTDCDHFANISPWEWRACEAGREVRRARMLPDGSLDLDHLNGLLDERTRVVAMAMAGNGLGTLLPVAAAASLAREKAPRAWVVVDAVHAAPHMPIDVQALEIDALAFSAYKLFGPAAGVLWLRADRLTELRPFHVEPHTEAETLMEWGTLNNANAAGIGAALDYLHGLGVRLEPAVVGGLTAYPRDRRTLKIALTAIAEYEAALSRRVLERLVDCDGITLFGVCDPAGAARRVPTFAFEFERVALEETELRCWEAGIIQVAVGSHYSAAIRRGLGRESLARASFCHYNDDDDVEAFIDTVTRLAALS